MKVVREVGLERRETVRFLSAGSVMNPTHYKNTLKTQASHPT